MVIKSRSEFLKNGSQKMLKDRLKKYCVITQKTHVNNSEKMISREATPTVTRLTIEEYCQNLIEVYFNLTS